MPPVPYRDPYITPVSPNAALLVQADATLVEVMVVSFIPSLDKCQSPSRDILAGSSHKIQYRIFLEEP